MASLKKKGKTLNEEAKEIICRVIEICDEEASTGKVQFCLNQRNKRVCNYTGISSNTVTKIRRECKESGNSKSSTPGKHRYRPLSTVAHIDYFGIHVVRNTIKDFYLLQKGELNCSKLLAAVKEKVDFPWGNATLRRLLRDMGFKWKKSGKQRHNRILIEHPRILMWRFKYLKCIRKAREDNMNIIYLGETLVDSSLTCKKYWLNNGSTGMQTNISPSDGLIILHASGETGFVENAQLIFKTGQTTGDCDGHMNCRTFEKWLTEKLLPNVPQNSVIILDSSPNNSIEQNRVPTEYATKTTMIAWLEKNNILFSPQMYKVELFNLIKKCKSNEKAYHIDELLKVKGHMVLRLPPYTFELNPTEFAWDKVENKIREKDLAVGSSVDDLEMAVIEGMNSITAADWKRYYSNVIKIENDYWDTDEAMDAKMEKYTVNLVESDSASDTGSDLA